MGLASCMFVFVYTVRTVIAFSNFLGKIYYNNKNNGYENSI